MSDIIYLYGFVPIETAAPPPDLRGLDDAAVELLDIGAVYAVTSRLDGAIYRADSLEPRLQDLAWVGQQGLCHERVVLWFVDHSDIVPARLFSLYAGTTSLQQALAPRADDIATTLRAFAGSREWNLKVAYDSDTLGRHGSEVSPDLRRMDDEIAAASPGRRYLLVRKRGDMMKREVARSARRIAGELLDDLAVYARQQRTLPLAGADQAGTVVLSAALLVDRANEATLRRAAEQQVESLGRLGVLVEFSGPWAPYRFLANDVDA